MTLINEASDGFTVDARLREVLGVLDIKKLNDPETESEETARNILFSFNIHASTDAYKALLIPSIAAKLYREVDDHDVITKVLAACVYITSGAKGTVTHAKVMTEFYSFMSGGNSEEKKTRSSLRVGELPSFSGDDNDWLIWKERAEAQFKIDGLYKCLTSSIYAYSHEYENVAVHGMLTKALLQSSTSGHFACLMDNKDDGHKAWKTLTEYYECEEHIKNILRELFAKLEEMKLTEVSNWKEHVEEFMALKNRIVMFSTRAKEASLSNINVYMVDDWKKKFLSQIHIPALNSRMDFCSKDKEMDLWKTILDLKAYIHEKHAAVKKARTKSKHITVQKEEVTKPAAEAPSKTDKNASMVQNLYNQISAITDEKLKKQVKDMMAKAKGASTEKTVKFKGKKRKRRVVQDDSESTKSEEMEVGLQVDEGALGIWNIS